MNQKRSVAVTLRFTTEEVEHCQALLASVGTPSLTLSAFLHDKVVALVQEEKVKPTTKKGASK